MTSHSFSSESGSGTDDFPFIDWSHFEPNSVQIYDGSGSAWVMGRALWRPSYTAAITSALPDSPEGSASLDLPPTLRGTVPQGLYEDEGLTPTLNAEKRPASYFPARPHARSDSTFKTISRPLNAHVFPLPGPGTDDIVRQVGFFIARANDPEGQARLRLEIQGVGGDVQRGSAGPSARRHLDGQVRESVHYYTYPAAGHHHAPGDVHLAFCAERTGRDANDGLECP